MSRGDIDAALTRRLGWMPYRLLSGTALFGCAFVMLCDIAMWFIVDGYNPAAQTISELAAGPHHEIQDAGIIVFVIGILSLAAGLVLRGKETPLAWAARVSFILLAIDVALIALWNEYGDRDSGGPVIHKYLVMALYALVALALWLGTTAAHSTHRPLSRISRGAACVWVVIAPFFYLVPESVNGAYERLLAGIMIAAVGGAAIVLYRKPDHL